MTHDETYQTDKFGITGVGNMPTSIMTHNELQAKIIRLLSETKTYPIETEGGTFEFIPQFIAISLVNKAFEEEL